MPSNIQNVSFTDPRLLYAPDAIVQQQQIQRTQQLADALRQESMQDTEVAPGSRVSWTQGLARLGEALAASRQYKQVDQRTQALAHALSPQARAMYGAPPLPGSQPGPTPQPTPSQGAPLPPSPPSDTTGHGVYGSGGVEDNGNLPPPQAAPPQAPPPQAPVQQNQPGPWSLTGDPNKDMSLATLSPDEYGKAVVSANAPVDMAKTVAQARAAMERGDMATAQTLLASVQKQNYIAPISIRQGGVALDPVTHQPIFQAAQAPEGSNVNYGPDGKAQSITPIQGGAAAIQTAAAAKAVGGAAGDLVQVYDQNSHQMVNVPKSALLSGAANGQAPMAAAPPLGADAAFNVTGKNSANAFTDISNGAADVPNRIYALRQMQSLTADPNSKFGVGSEGLNHFNSLLGTISQSAGIQFDPKAATNANEFQKWATQYSARSGQELGLSGSDARTQLAVHATPNGEMTRQALQSVVPQMIGIENAKQGYAQAANAWQQTHGPQSVQEFRTEWNKVYNPSIYTHMAQGPQAFVGWVKTLKPAEAAQIRQQYVQLKQIGALPQ